MIKKMLAVLVVAALSTAARSGRAQQVYVVPPPPPPVYVEPPPTGVGLIVGGAIFTGIGGINLLTAPLCVTSLIPSDAQTVCLGASLGIGIGGLAIGIPMLVVGSSRRRAYLEWKRSGGFAASLTDLEVKPVPGGGALSWHASF